MDELFANLRFLIPIAFIIAIRILNARQRQVKKEQQKKSTGELTGKIQEAQKNPAYAKALTEDTEVYIPPAGQPRPAPAWPDTRKKAAMKKPAAKTLPKSPPPPKYGAYHSAFPETVSVKEASGSVSEESERRGPENTVTAVAQHTGVNAVSSVGQKIILPGIHDTPPGNLTPLQQALVWSEILGAPRSDQI
jgi:hypothetical protein